MRRTSPGRLLLAFAVTGLAITQAVAQVSRPPADPGPTTTQHHQQQLLARADLRQAAAAAGALLRQKGEGEDVPKDKKGKDDQLKKLSQRLDQVAKDVATLKGLAKRVAAAEKAAKDAADKAGKDSAAVRKRLDDLAAQVKAQGDALKAVEKLKDVPARLDKLEQAVKDLNASLQKLQESLKKLEPIGAQLKALEGRVGKLEKAAGGLEPRLKALADQAAKDRAAAEDRVKALEEQLKKEREEREKALKALEERQPGRRGPGAGAAPEAGAAPFLPPGGHVMPAEPEMHGPPMMPPMMPPMLPEFCNPGYLPFGPGVGFGCFGERFPVLVPLWWGGGGGGDMMPPGAGFGGGAGAEHVPMMPQLEGDTAPGGGGRDRGAEPGKAPAGGPSLGVPPSDAAGTQVLSKLVSRRRPTAAAPARPARVDRDGLGPADADRLFWRGYRLYWQGEYAEAHALLSVAVDLAGEDARYWYFKSLCETALGEPLQAGRSLRRAVALHLAGKPSQAEIGKALERVQGRPRAELRQALDAGRRAGAAAGE